MNRDHSQTIEDFLLGHIAFLFGPAYPESIRIVREQRYLEQMLSFESRNPQIADRLKEIRQMAEEYLDEVSCE